MSCELAPWYACWWWFLVAGKVTRSDQPQEERKKQGLVSLLCFFISSLMFLSNLLITLRPFQQEALCASNTAQFHFASHPCEFGQTMPLFFNSLVYLHVGNIQTLSWLPHCWLHCSHTHILSNYAISATKHSNWFWLYHFNMYHLGSRQPNINHIPINALII